MHNWEPSCILVDIEGSESEYPFYKETFNSEHTLAIAMTANIYRMAGEIDAIKCLTRSKWVKKCF